MSANLDISLNFLAANFRHPLQGLTQKRQKIFEDINFVQPNYRGYCFPHTPPKYYPFMVKSLNYTAFFKIKLGQGRTNMKKVVQNPQ